MDRRQSSLVGRIYRPPRFAREIVGDWRNRDRLLADIRAVGGELVFQGVSDDKFNSLATTARFLANSKPRHRKANRTLGECRDFAGISPDPL